MSLYHLKLQVHIWERDLVNYARDKMIITGLVVFPIAFFLLRSLEP